MAVPEEMMINSKGILITLSVFLLCLQCVACRSEVTQADEQRVKSLDKTVIEDNEWQIEVLNKVPLERSPLNISCANEGLCWVWNYQSLWATEREGGWRQIKLNENELVNNAFVMSSGVGWVVASSGLYKQDPAKNWTKIAIADLDNREGQVCDINFQEIGEGWIAGGKYRKLKEIEGTVNNAISEDRTRILTGYIASTLDGGKTWNAHVFERSIGRFERVKFYKQLGVAYGDAGCIVTNDGGKQWIEPLIKYRDKDTGESPQALGAFLLDENNGWIVLSGARIVATHDGGKTWSLIHGPTKSQPDVITDTLGDIAFVDQFHGLAVSEGSNGGRLLKTSDGGKSWSEINTDERFRQLAMMPTTRRGILLGIKHIYLISLS